MEGGLEVAITWIAAKDFKENPAPHSTTDLTIGPPRAIIVREQPFQEERITEKRLKKNTWRRSMPSVVA